MEREVAVLTKCLKKRKGTLVLLLYFSFKHSLM